MHAAIETIRTIRRGLVYAALWCITPAYAAGQWLDVQDTNLEISAGNALDFSDLFGPVDLEHDNPANKRVRVNAQGNMSLDGTKPHRFLCAAMNFAGPWEEIPDRAGAQRIATQLRRHGYNLVRMHHVEGMLMEGVEKSPDNDFKFNPEKQARLYDFLSVMKDNGMHWALDMVTDDTAAWGEVGKDRAANSKIFRSKLFVHYDPAYQAHWKGIVDRLYDQDYDGTGPAGTILRDPALASATLFNELTLVYNLRKMPGDQLPDTFKDEMIAWAAKRNPPVTLTREEIPNVSDVLSPHAGLLLEFFTYKERRTVRWMEPYVRSRAAPELLLVAYNNGRVVQAVASRNHLDAVNIHGYHDAEGRPSKSRNHSSFSDSLTYLQNFATHRYEKKPLFVDEYDIPYWNKWRREAGITAPAYASLQDWDGLCRYSNPVTLEYRGIRNVPRTNRIYPFSIGMDPIARAGETLAALLFRRGDVAPSPNVFTINYSDSFLHDPSSGNEAMPTSIGRLALLSKIVVKRTYANSPKPLKKTFTPDPSLIGPPGPDQESPWRTHFAKWQAAVPGNASYMSPDVAHYVSDTGQLVTHIEVPRGSDSVHHMSVRTPRTEAHVFQANHLPPTQTGDRLVVESADTDALVSLSSIDPLKADGTGN
ncbi:MAG TPA: hypothetical protein VJM53_08230, partial [Burkholderiales bacterium]|nr:hypothetical protein [Burkholderiales bacterium]